MGEGFGAGDVAVAVGIEARECPLDGRIDGVLLVRFVDGRLGRDAASRAVHENRFESAGFGAVDGEAVVRLDADDGLGEPAA